MWFDVTVPTAGHRHRPRLTAQPSGARRTTQKKSGARQRRVQSNRRRAFTGARNQQNWSKSPSPSLSHNNALTTRQQEHSRGRCAARLPATKSAGTAKSSPLTNAAVHLAMTLSAVRTARVRMMAGAFAATRSATAASTAKSIAESMAEWEKEINASARATDTLANSARLTSAMVSSVALTGHVRPENVSARAIDTEVTIARLTAVNTD